VSLVPVITGQHLRVERERYGLTARRIAREYGVHASRISQIERLTQPSLAAIAKYLAAIEAARRRRGEVV
jgi:transcriptional regulator with XRE-family HTH domain